MNTERLIDQLIRDEGLKLKPYTDTVGKLTIGIGRNLDDVGISESEARYMLKNDISKVLAELTKQNWFNGLDEPRQVAIANMAFNLGVEGLLGFKNMIDCLKCGKFKLASEHALASKWAGQVGARARRIAEQIATGVYQ